jgi:transposase
MVLNPSLRHTLFMTEAPAPSEISVEEWTATPAAVQALVHTLVSSVRQLQQQVAELERRLNQNSGNSSQPPSRDQKSNRPAKVRGRPRGGKPGHVRAVRVLSDAPDQRLELRVTSCCHCQHDLRSVAPRKIIRRQVTELPVVRPVIIETCQHEVLCPHCHTVQRGSLPNGLEATRTFGPRLEATVVYLQQQHHLSYARTRHALHDLFGVTLSEGGEACIVARAGQAAAPLAETLRQQLQASPVIGSDETGVRIDGRTYWEWVFVTPHLIYHHLAPKRNRAVIQQVMGAAQAQVWISDCWQPQLQAPRTHFQLCLTHQIRNLQGLIEQRPHLRWAQQMQDLLRAAIHLGKRRNALTARGFQSRRTQLHHTLDRLLRRPIRTRPAHALHYRFQKYRRGLLYFLSDDRVPFHNSACERALRPSVIHRKVTGGFRSVWGAEGYVALASVIDTAKLQGRNVFECLVNLMGKPVLPFLTALNGE